MTDTPEKPSDQRQHPNATIEPARRAANERMAVTEAIMARISARSSAAIPATNPAEDLFIARDYLQQHQARNTVDLLEHVFVGMTRAGWLDPRIAASLTDRIRLERSSRCAEFEKLLSAYCHWIEQKCIELKISLHSGVACGIVWNPTLGPGQQSVLTTNASVIVIPESTLMLCHFFSKLLAHTLPVKGTQAGAEVTFDAAQVIERFRSNRRLQRYAIGFLAFFATLRRTWMPLKKIRGPRRTVWTKLLLATELFVVAHEYGHHIALHKLGDSADAEGPPELKMRAEELEADYLAALLMAHIGAEMDIPVAFSGAAGVVALIGMDLVRRSKSILETGTVQNFSSDTHPPLKNRLLMLETLRYDSRNIESVRGMRHNFREIMEGIWGIVEPDLKELHARGVRPVTAAPSGSQWLPFWG
jgi:hypothetical protein